MESIAEYGSDALRLGILASRSAGQNQAFSTTKVIAGRNFSNKLWNISRFILDKLGEGYRPTDPEPTSMADHWIIQRLTDAAQLVESQLADYRIAEASETVYHTIWDDVADWFIEASKIEDNKTMLVWVLENSLKLAHPFAPFVTETIWQTLWWKDSLLMKEAWPAATSYDKEAANTFGQLQELVSEIRFVSAELPVRDGHTLLFTDDILIAKNSQLIRHLAKLKDVSMDEQPHGLKLAVSGHEAWLAIEEKTLSKHRKSLESRLEDAKSRAVALEQRLSNTAYTEKAPALLVEQSRTQLEEQQALISRLETELSVIQ